MELIDSQGRVHDYLRISVTDRCNLRCLYCMGPEGITQIPHQEILSYEEIIQVIKTATPLGIRRIRITGGEPLTRKGLPRLLEQISEIPAIKDLSMTTNGILLPRYAASLKAAGLKRVNISLDSLKPEKYRAITRKGDLSQALRGIDTALELGLTPVKINTVLIKGFNDDEVPELIKLVQEKPVHLRFIEYMPIGDHDHNYSQHYLPLSFVQEAARAAGLPLTPTAPRTGAGPAEWFTIPGGQGTVGLIHPISRHYCHHCNRLRLTPDGYIKTCLYWEHEYPVRPCINDPEALTRLLLTAVKEKPARHLMQQETGAKTPRARRSMSKTGG
ncbi:MAG: GTP 3',8-cyclase MoaA [Firmicutes bacterium]|nr:GTP 3',8-cyclase MoaA [Bacillota bacterium]